MKRTFFFFPVFCVVVFFFSVMPLGAQSLWSSFSLSFDGSILFFPEDNGREGDPMPVLPSPGAALAYPIWGPLYAELTLDLYFTNYRYSVALNRAVPAAIENRSAFVFGTLLGIQAVGRFPLSEKFTARAYGGPAADLRIITLAADLNPRDTIGPLDTNAQLQTDAVREYFWGKGRWFMPVIGGGIDYTINEKFLLGLDFRTWFPLYRIWSGENLPAVEGWRFGAGLRFTIR
ncbi:MAG: hypothetical protein LBP23_10045 [Treponema sp.]|nr:hypothetical protein [Treponema sp.]